MSEGYARLCGISLIISKSPSLIIRIALFKTNPSQLDYYAFLIHLEDFEISVTHVSRCI